MSNNQTSNAQALVDPNPRGGGWACTKNLRRGGCAQQPHRRFWGLSADTILSVVQKEPFVHEKHYCCTASKGGSTETKQTSLAIDCRSSVSPHAQQKHRRPLSSRTGDNQTTSRKNAHVACVKRTYPLVQTSKDSACTQPRALAQRLTLLRGGLTGRVAERRTH